MSERRELVKEILRRSGASTSEQLTKYSEATVEELRAELATIKPKWAYASIDIETTGLAPEKCQTLEIGIVLDDYCIRLSELPRFHCYVAHKFMVGDPFALSMHPTILRRIADHNAWYAKSPAARASTPHPHPKFQFVEPEYVATAVANWLREQGCSGTIVPAGKNFGSFDRQFLNRIADFSQQIRFHHRQMDPAMLFWNPLTDDVPPDSKTCMERAGIPGDVAHTALEDALGVVQMIRIGRQMKINDIGRLTETRSAHPVDGLISTLELKAAAEGGKSAEAVAATIAHDLNILRT